jgi:AcrR family transcriptional regulator
MERLWCNLLVPLQVHQDHLGIAKGTIYHYFKSKEELLEAVIEDIVEENLEKMQTLIQKAKGNALQNIQILVEAGNISMSQTHIWITSINGAMRPCIPVFSQSLC